MVYKFISFAKKATRKHFNFKEIRENLWYKKSGVTNEILKPISTKCGTTSTDPQDMLKIKCNILNSLKLQSEEHSYDQENLLFWKNTKITVAALAATFLTIGVCLVMELGQPYVDERGNPKEDEFSHLPIYKQYLLRFMRDLEMYTNILKEPSREKLLPDPIKAPFHQPPYTLVIELTDVLVHPEWTYLTGWRFKKRPGVDYFLQNISKYFEIVIYTAECGTTVFPIVENLDKNRLISYKLVRDSTHFVNGHHVKDINKLNRNLGKVVVIDWNPDSVKLNPENLFRLQRWKGNDDDTTLYDLVAFLYTIANSNIEDVRSVLDFYKQFPEPLSTFKERQKLLMDKLDQSNDYPKTLSIIRNWTPSLTRNFFD